MTSEGEPVGWVEHAVWWQVYPLGFTGAPIREPDVAPRPSPRLDGLLPWLDHVVALGANGLLLGPVFASASHGYDTLDHYRIDPRLGDDDAFGRLVAACRARGVRLVLDGVFNHVGAGNPLVVRALAEGPDGELARWFRVDWDAPGGPRPDVFEGHASLVELNHDEPAVAAFVGDVMVHWLERGADGWRLDAAYRVPPAFWAGVLPAVRRRFPDAWFVGEVLHGDYPGYVRSSTLDSVTQYQLWKAIWSSLADRNFFELDWALRRHDDFLDSFVPQTFVGNHDVTRIASRVGPDGAVLGLVVLMTVGGVPSIYYGDEWGMTGVKEDRLGGDDAVRPAFPASAAELPADGARIFRAHQDLIGLRRRHPWLLGARTTVTTLENTRYAYRTSGSGGALTVELDVTAAPRARVLGPGGDVLFAWG
ncbi:MAG TPA: alpha-amylase family protein [Cellulomonas sp.]